MPLLVLWVLLAIGFALPGHAEGQGDSGLSDREPRFFAVVSARQQPRQISATKTPVLARRIAVAFKGAPLDEALHTIARAGGFELAYSTAMVSVGRRVNLKAQEITVAGALSEVLRDLGVDVLFSGNQKAVLFRRGSVPQPVAVSGRITDVQTGTGIVGAEVRLAGTAWHAATDSTGRYTLAEVDPGVYTLTARRIGYAKLSRQITVRAESGDTFDVALRPTATRLDELVTTATGRQRRAAIANDVTTINADSVMRTAPIRSLTDLLDTRVPGLTVQRTSGAPGDPARLRLRGPGSPLRSNDPIVVVDGIRINADASRTRNLAGGNFNTPSALDYVDPNSVETVEVLKGPSAATLYGPDAANGVIVITTKKGKAGPTSWSTHAELGQTRMAGEFPDLMIRWGHRFQSSEVVPCPVGNITVPDPVFSASSGLYLSCSADSVVHFQLLNDPSLTVLDRGHRASLSMGASGGSGALTYAVTGSYQDETGLPMLPSYEADLYQARVHIAPPDWMRRPQNYTTWNLTANFRARLSAAADLTLSSDFFHGSQQRSDLESQLGTLMSLYLDKASGTTYTSDGFNGRLVPGGSIDHGFLQSYFTRGLAKPTQFVNKLGLDWRPRRGIQVFADAGLDVQHRPDEVYLPRGAIDTIGSLSTAQSNMVTGTINAVGTATVPLRHGFNFRFAAGMNYISTAVDAQTLYTSYLPFGTSQQGSLINSASHSDTSTATFGWYVEPSIGSSKLSFSAGLRLDGSTSYGGGLSGLSLPKLPKLGFAYLISDESWFPFKNLFQSLRLRTAYGKSGRQPGITDRLRTYGTFGNVLVNGQRVDEVKLQTLGNTQLRPERSTELEGGFDADLFDSRLTLNVSGYRKTTDDALLPKPVAPSVYGDLTIWTNIGRIRNTGLNLDVTGQLVRTPALTWSTHLGLTQERSMVVNLGSDVQPFYTDGGDNTTGGIRVAAGYPLYGRWSVPILGYADVNGNGGLEANEILIGDTAVYVGLTEPNYMLSFSSTLSLFNHAITLDAGFDYRNGLSQVNTVAQRLMAFSQARNDSTSSLVAQLGAFNGAGDIGTNYNWIQTVNTFRFNSFSVRYQVPAALTRRLGAQQLSIALQGGNLALWTNYHGVDPNVNTTATGNNVIDTGILPMPRTWQLQINATY